MELLVKFIAAENKVAIADNGAYIQEIVKKLIASGLIKSIMVNPSELEFGADIVREIDEEGNVFMTEFNCEESGQSDNWQIIFQYGTYNTAEQLEISIQSDTYSVEQKNYYLERLKVEIKKAVVKDWKDIIWLIDKDSECLSIELYPQIYKIENLLRELINDVMIKQYGTTWWESLVPYDIKDKHKARLGEYKSKVPSFNNVDDRLMSIDIDDLGKIITLVRYKWNPQYDEELNCLINGVQKIKEDKLIELIKKQRVEDINLWKEQFSRYLSEGFPDKFIKFSKDRNHIMHNKLLDRAAYNMIKTSADEIEEDIKTAIQKERRIVLSNEEKLEIEKKRMIEIQMLEELDHECRENDANVSIRTDDEIRDLFEESIFELIHAIEARFRFRSDVEIITRVTSISESRGELMSIKSRVDETELLIKYDMTLIDEEGADSELEICCEGEKINFSECIVYTNGEVEYDSESGLYMPITQDEISDISELTNNLEEFVNDEIENYREIVEPEDLAEFVCCSECGDDSICVNEEIMPLGTCLSCGYHNKVYKCERCGEWFNIEEGGFYNEDDDIAICDSCVKQYEEE